MAFAAQLFDQIADAPLVLLVGALEFGDVVVDEGFEFAGAAEGARHGVVHERHLAADSLSEAGDRLFGGAVRLGEADRDFAHRRRFKRERGDVPVQQGEQPDDSDRRDDRGGRVERAGCSSSARERLRQLANQAPASGRRTARPTTAQTTLPIAASRKTLVEGFCSSA